MDTDEIRAVVEAAEPGTRLASAIANVCGVTTPDYLPMVELAGLLSRFPGTARIAARTVAGQLSVAAAARQARLLSRILAVLEDLDLGTPEREEQVAALRGYRDMLADALTGTAWGSAL